MTGGRAQPPSNDPPERAASPLTAPPAGSGVTSADFRAHGLSEDDEACILETMGRPPRPAELGVLSVLWSEHCAYRTTRALLQTLPTSGVRVLQGPGENAGVVDIGDGLALVFKIESHNHPSAIEPFHGAATGVGGILRDVFTMGARPFALGLVLRFGQRGSVRTERLVQGVVAGAAHYGNSIGVPTVTADFGFDEAFADNVLVNAFACGVVSAAHVVLGRATPPGSLVLLFGSPTGRDGIHGATMASAAFGEGSSPAPRTLQVGDPFTGKRVLGLCLALAEAALVSGMQDLGAAGLSSSTVEMAARSGTGMDLWLSEVPRRASQMSAYEVLLSETQERMVAIACPSNLDKIKELAVRFRVPLSLIGEVTGGHRWIVRERRGSAVVACDLDVPFLASGAPPRAFARAEGETAPRAAPARETPRALIDQLDQTVGGATLLGIEGDAAVLRVIERGVEKLVAFGSGSPRGSGAAAPGGYAAGFGAVVEACLRVAAVGATPIALTNGQNFGSPSLPSVMSELAAAIAGLGDACRLLGVPVVSGNVSLSNQTEGRAIPPSPFVIAVGLFPDCGAAIEGRLARSRFDEPDVPLWLVAAGNEAALPRLIAFAVALGAGGIRRVVHVVPGGDVALGVAEMSQRLDALDTAFGARALPYVASGVASLLVAAHEETLPELARSRGLTCDRLGETGPAGKLTACGP